MIQKTLYNNTACQIICRPRHCTTTTAPTPTMLTTAYCTASNSSSDDMLSFNCLVKSIVDEKSKQKYDVGSTTSLFSLLSHSDRRKNSLLPKKDWSNVSYKRNLFTLCADNYEETIDLGIDSSSSCSTSDDDEVSDNSSIDEMSRYCTRPYKRQRRSHHLVGLRTDLATSSSDNNDLLFPSILNEDRKEGCALSSTASFDENTWGFFMQ